MPVSAKPAGGPRHSSSLNGTGHWRSDGCWKEHGFDKPSYKVPVTQVLGIRGRREEEKKGQSYALRSSQQAWETAFTPNPWDQMGACIVSNKVQV